METGNLITIFSQIKEYIKHTAFSCERIVIIARRNITVIRCERTIVVLAITVMR